MIVELTLLPLAMIVVFLRMWVRVRWLHKSWYDDYLMVAAMVRIAQVSSTQGSTNALRFSLLVPQSS